MTASAPDLDAVRADVEALAAMERASASEGERASAAWIAGRLRDAGAGDVEVRPFRYQGTYAWAHALHAGAGLAALGLRGWRGAALAAGALVSLELEASGRSQWVRRLLPAGEGANVVARIPPSGPRRATVVLAAHHDAARTGLAWHPRIKQAAAGRQLRRRTIDPALAPFGAGLALAGAGALLPGRAGAAARGAAAAILGLTVAAYADIARSPVVPGASDNATGVAAVLELARQAAAAPVPGVELILLFPGCEESGMGGMAAWLAEAGPDLDPATTLVLGLDTLGGGRPAVLTAEATLLTQRYREEDLGLADRGAARAGVPAPERWRLGTWTDPVLARFAGLPALSILALGPGYLPHHHLMSDTPANVDWGSVDACIRLAAGIVAEVGAEVPRRPRPGDPPAGGAV
ncbi:MAG: M28 family peptidase [Solirubrobacteraceae bacterium]